LRILSFVFCINKYIHQK
ncbi:hypothetical protein NPIL_533711, partial [Nephila pilipes]